MTLPLESNWGSLFNELYREKTYSDITFVYGIHKIKSHNLVLMMRAPDFHKQIVDAKCNTEINVINVTSSYDIFNEFIKFIYTGTLELKEDTIVEMTQLASLYKMELLIEKCMQWLKLQLTIENACIILQKVLQHKDLTLIQVVLEFIRIHFKAVLETSAFLDLNADAMEHLLKVEGIETGNEVDMHNAVVQWSRTHLTKQGKTFSGTEMRELLGDLIILIRYPTMNSIEFTQCVTQNIGLLRQDEIGAIYLEINAKHKNNFGFNNRLRTEKYNLPIDSTNLHELIINDHPNYHWLPEIPSNITEFTTSVPIALIGVHVTGGDRPIDVTIHLLNENDEFITQGRGLIPQQNFSRVDFEVPISIQAGRKYKVILEYEKIDGAQYWCYFSKNVPFNTVKCDVEFVFTKLSQMIYKIYFK